MRGLASPQATYFCTELAAALWQHCGVMLPTCNAASFWPADFAQGGVCERWLTKGVELGPEVVLEPAFWV